VTLLTRWELDERGLREGMYRAPTARERERWHARWLLSRGWSEARVSAALERDPHTIGQWLASFAEAGPTGMGFEQTGGPPPPSTRPPKPS
jgi:Homeodomain-like domain